MGQPVIAYARVNNGNRERLLTTIRKFAEVNSLAILEEYIEQGHTADAWTAAFQRLSKDQQPHCSILIPSLSALGESRREVRARMAGLRAAGIPIYEAEGGMLITWTAGQIEATPWENSVERERNA